MNHRSPLYITLLLLTFITAVAEKPATQPNILLILTDDQGFGDVSLHGNPYVETPFIDSMMQQSVEFRNFHAAPLCAPTRASLMTGKHHLKAGVWGVHGGRDYMDLNQTTLAQRLSNAGYRTAMTGKWHLGKTDAYLPYNRGFDESWSIIDRLYQHTDPVLDHNGIEEKPKGWTVDILNNIALKWIDSDAEQPFFFYLAHPYIHEPYYAPDDLVQKYQNMGLSESFATLCAMTEHLDASLKAFFKSLEERGLLENTVVFFMGDNGPIGNPVNLPHLTDEEMDFRNQAGYKGVKGNPFENGTRAPCFVNFGDRFETRISQQELDVTDIQPTILDLAGVDFDPESFDGVSQLKHLKTGKPTATPDRFYANHQVEWDGKDRLYSYLDNKSMLTFEPQTLAIRKGDWKYVRFYGSIELYNLATDPQEKMNLIQSYPEMANELKYALKNWWVDVVAENASYQMPMFPLPTVKGRKISLHPCASSKIHGDITQTGFFSQNWTESGDGIVYEVKVNTPGTYQIDASVISNGSDLQLQLTGADETTLVEVPNGKHFLEIGEITLDKGVSELGLFLKKSANSSGRIESIQQVYCTRLD